VYYTSTFLQLSPVIEVKPEDTAIVRKTVVKKDDKKTDDKKTGSKKNDGKKVDKKDEVKEELKENIQEDTLAVAAAMVDTTTTDDTDTTAAIAVEEKQSSKNDKQKKGTKNTVAKKTPAKKTPVKEKKPEIPEPEAQFLNEIVALTKDRNGKLYFTGANGTLFAVDGNTITKEEELYSKIKAGLSQSAVVGSYDFAEPQTTRMFDANAATPFFKFPKLVLTPDEKVLVYTVKDQLFIAEAANLSNVKKYSLTFKPTDSYFGRENNGYTLYLRGENEFTFPITKKYSIDALVNNYDPNANVYAGDKGGSGGGSSSAAPSVADEITKLKKLLDDGIITKDEFDQGKKKILGGN
jgi:hypothetical protein